MKRGIKITKIASDIRDIDETYVFNYFTELRMSIGIKLIDISVPCKNIFCFLVKGKAENIVYLLQKLIIKLYPYYRVE